MTDLQFLARSKSLAVVLTLLNLTSLLAPISSFGVSKLRFNNTAEPVAAPWEAFLEPFQYFERTEYFKLLESAKEVLCLADSFVSPSTMINSGFTYLPLPEMYIDIRKNLSPDLSSKIHFVKAGLPCPTSLKGITFDFGSEEIEYLEIDNRKAFEGLADNRFDLIVMRKGLCVCHETILGRSCGGIDYKNREATALFFREVVRVLNKNNPNAIAILGGTIRRPPVESAPEALSTKLQKKRTSPEETGEISVSLDGSKKKARLDSTVENEPLNEAPGASCKARLSPPLEVIESTLEELEVANPNLNFEMLENLTSGGGHHFSAVRISVKAETAE